MKGNLEQRYTIKVCVRLKKTTQEGNAMLNEANEDKQMSKTIVYRWFNRFSAGNERVKNEPRSGAPKNARRKENI